MLALLNILVCPNNLIFSCPCPVQWHPVTGVYQGLSSHDIDTDYSNMLPAKVLPKFPVISSLYHGWKYMKIIRILKFKCEVVNDTWLLLYGFTTL